MAPVGDRPNRFVKIDRRKTGYTISDARASPQRGSLPIPTPRRTERSEITRTVDGAGTAQRSAIGESGNRESEHGRRGNPRTRPKARGSFASEGRNDHCGSLRSSALVGNISPGRHHRSPGPETSSGRGSARIGRIRSRAAWARSSRPVAGDDPTGPIGFLTGRLSLRQSDVSVESRHTRSPTLRMPQLSDFLNAPIAELCRRPPELSTSTGDAKIKKEGGAVDCGPLRAPAETWKEPIVGSPYSPWAVASTKSRESGDEPRRNRWCSTRSLIFRHGMVALGGSPPTRMGRASPVSPTAESACPWFARWIDRSGECRHDLVRHLEPVSR